MAPVPCPCAPSTSTPPTPTLNTLIPPPTLIHALASSLPQLGKPMPCLCCCCAGCPVLEKPYGHHEHYLNRFGLRGKKTWLLVFLGIIFLALVTIGLFYCFIKKDRKHSSTSYSRRPPQPFSSRGRSAHTRYTRHTRTSRRTRRSRRSGRSSQHGRSAQTTTKKPSRHTTIRVDALTKKGHSSRSKKRSRKSKKRRSTKHTRKRHTHHHKHGR